jgi:hypothetical protein
MALALPASAQEVLVQNGATLQAQNGAVLDLEGGQMNLGGAGATAVLDETGTGRVTGGTLTATRALNAPDGADPAGLGVILSADVDLGDVTVTRGHTAQSADGNQSIERYYDIEPSQNNSGLSAQLTFTYNDDELATLSGTESELELFKSTDDGSSWSEEGFNTRDETNNTVYLSGISSFSWWTLGSESNPLPVELANFEAARTRASGDQEAVRLHWQTASETGNAGFEVQRTAAGSASAPWQTVGFRESKVEGGTTSEDQTYRFVDEDLPYAADTLSYRLRQVDLDGSATLTDQVRVARGGVERLQLEKTFPNPARSRVTVRFAVPENTDETGVTMRLYDVLGRRMRSVAQKAETGRHETQLSVSGLSSGVYFLRLSAGPTTETRRLTVVK